MSLEPAEMKAFAKMVRDLEIALGNNRRLMSEAERTRRLAVRRSAHLARDLSAGHVLAEPDIEFRRPGHGIPPDRAQDVIGARLRKAGAKGQLLAPTDLER
jgi:sialic acid synthase SpsE